MQTYFSYQLCGHPVSQRTYINVPVVYMGRYKATTNFRGPVAHWTRRLTMNQKIAGSSPARIDRVLCGKDLDRLVWQADRPHLMSEVLCCNGQCV
jgi:hypothetical protein